MIFSRMFAGVDQSMRPQHQETRIEPRREQVREVLVQHVEHGLLFLVLEQLLAHPHELGGAARREVQPADDLLPFRLGGGVQLLQRGGRALLTPVLDGAVETARIRSEVVGQRDQEIALGILVEHGPRRRRFRAPGRRRRLRHAARRDRERGRTTSAAEIGPRSEAGGRARTARPRSAIDS